MYELAALKLNQGDARQALEVLQEARNNLPQTFMLEFYSGLAMTSLRQYASALKFLRSAEQLAEEKEPSRLTGFFYFRKGSVQERLGQLQEAEDSFLKCLQKDPEDATTLNYLGYMWAEHGKKLDDAFEWIQKALDLEPDSEAILDSMGWVLFQQGKPEEALLISKRQSRSSPNRIRLFWTISGMSTWLWIVCPTPRSPFKNPWKSNSVSRFLKNGIGCWTDRFSEFHPLLFFLYLPFLINETPPPLQPRRGQGSDSPTRGMAQRSVAIVAISGPLWFLAESHVRPGL